MQDPVRSGRWVGKEAASRMLTDLGRWAEEQPRWVFGLISTVVWLAVSAVDTATGNQLDLAIFYLAPVILASWFVTRSMGAALAVLSAVSWTGISLLLGAAYTNPLIPLGDTLVRLTFFAITIFLTSLIKKSMANERRLSRTDGLTGVANMRAFEDRVSLELNHMRRNETPMTFVFIDLDAFKAVNDTMGHHEGDEVLRRIAEALQRRLRSTDMVVRLGGDEFGILLPDTGFEAAGDVLAQVREAVADSVRSRWDVDITAGAITFLEPPAGVDELVGLADTRMYEGKRAGGGVTVHTLWPDVDVRTL